MSLYIHGIAVVVMAIAITAAHWLTALKLEHWHDLLQRLYFFPIVYGGLKFGWKGGLASSVMAIALQLPHVMYAWDTMNAYAVGQILEMPLFIAAGLLTGVFVERDRRHSTELARTTKRLSEVYEQLQQNFDRMKRAERLYAMGQLAAGLAHEIRNPLASIAGASGILQRNARLEDTHLKVLQVIDKECQRLTRLLSNFLDFARPRAPRHQHVDADLILQSVIDLASHAQGARDIVMKKQVAPGLPPLDCDPEMVKQLLLNFVINAIQSMPAGGTVTLGAALRQGKMLISVADEGCGVAAEDRDKIFNPFFTTKDGGTGLGLAVAHQIVEQHGGVISAEPNGDRGMVFSALLPLHHENPS